MRISKPALVWSILLFSGFWVGFTLIFIPRAIKTVYKNTDTITQTDTIVQTTTVKTFVPTPPNPIKVLYSEQILGNIWKNPTFWITAFKTAGRECIEVDVTTDALSCWAN